MSKTSEPTERIRFMTRTDLTDLAAISVLLPLSWLTPQAWWPRISRALSSIIARVAADVTKARIQTLVRAAGKRDFGQSFDTLRLAIIDGYMEERLQLLRDYRPGGWRPAIELEGAEHIRTATENGRGCILWVCPFTHSDIVTKIAMHQAGFAVTHLSAFSRGFSPNSCYVWNRSWFGMKCLSPIRTHIENRYIKERVAIPSQGSLGYLRLLERRLKAGELVSIRCGEEGRRTFAVPFLEGSVSIASGPASLARSSGAHLLPVFTIPTGVASFKTIVEPALVPDSAKGSRDDVEDLVSQYGRILESYVTRYPHLWSGWYQMSLDDEESEATAATA